MKQILTLSSLLFASAVVSGQTAPVFSHFYANPFQFNPAYVAHNGYTEANIFYRKQWLNISNAPTTLAFNIQAPVGRNVSLGATVVSDQTVLLNTNTLHTTFGYRVRFGTSHHLNFGIAGGIGFNAFDFEAIGESSDPVLANVSENNTFLAGQVGIYYQLKNFSLGLALPKLFDSRPNSVESFNEIEFNEFKNRFASLSYTVNLRDVQLSPIAIYRTHDDAEDQWEGMLIASYKNLFWIGSSYRRDYGLTGFIGVNIKRLLRIGYAYEYPTGDIGKVAGGTHEVYLGGRLGKKNREELIAMENESRQDSVKDTSVATIRETEQPEEEPEEETAAPGLPVQTMPDRETAVETAQNEPQQTDTEEYAATEEDNAYNAAVMEEAPARPEETAPVTIDDNNPAADMEGFYLVVGVYKKLDNALRQMGVVKKDGKTPSILYRAEKDFYYVYTFHSKTRQETVTQWKIIRRENKYFGAWVYSVQK